MTDLLGIGDYQYELVPNWGQLHTIVKDSEIAGGVLE